MGRLTDLLLAARGEPTGSLSSLLGQWRLAVADRFADVDVGYPQLRVGRGLTAPTAIEAGPSMGWQMDVGFLLYAERPLHSKRDPAQNIILGLGWAPTSSEAGKTVTWQFAIGLEMAGSLVSTVDLTLTAADIAVPETAAEYVRTSVQIPAASIPSTADEIHVRITRVLTELDPTASPAIHHLVVVQQLG